MCMHMHIRTSTWRRGGPPRQDEKSESRGVYMRFPSFVGAGSISGLGLPQLQGFRFNAAEIRGNRTLRWVQVVIFPAGF